MGWGSWRWGRPLAAWSASSVGSPAILAMVLSTPDGRRQLGVMSNVLVAPDAMYEAFMRIFRELSPAEVSG